MHLHIFVSVTQSQLYRNQILPRHVVLPYLYGAAVLLWLRSNLCSTSTALGMKIPEGRLKYHIVVNKRVGGFLLKMVLVL